MQIVSLNESSDVKISYDNIDEVVLVGGSTYIPKIQSPLTDFFNGKEQSILIIRDNDYILC